MFVIWDNWIFVRLLDPFFHCETASPSVARGSKLSSYGATSASSPASPRKLCSKSLSKKLDGKFDGNHINMLQCLALCFRLFFILFSGLCCGDG